MKRFAVYLIIVFAFFGLADSVYLAQQANSGTPLICNIQNLSGCNIVASSEYSKVFGIPIAEFGVAFYSLLFVLGALEAALYNRAIRRTLQVLAVAGLAVSAYSTYIQMYWIQAYCIYCLMSAALTVGIFIFATLIEPLKRQAASPPAPTSRLTMPPA